MQQDVIHPNDPAGRYLFFEYNFYEPLNPMDNLTFRSSSLAYIKDLTSKIREGSVHLSDFEDAVLIYDLELNEVVYKAREDEVFIDLINGENK